jgi:hypothetical protein
VKAPHQTEGLLCICFVLCICFAAVVHTCVVAVHYVALLLLPDTPVIIRYNTLAQLVLALCTTLPFSTIREQDQPTIQKMYAYVRQLLPSCPQDDSELGFMFGRRLSKTGENSSTLKTKPKTEATRTSPRKHAGSAKRKVHFFYILFHS